MAGGWWRGTLVALVVFGAAAQEAHATVRKATGSDPTGDARGGDDVVAASAQADDATGQVLVGAGLAAPPTGYVIGRVGTLSNGVCGQPYVLFVGKAGNAVYALTTAPSNFKRATMSTQGNVVVLGATDPALALPFDCADVGTSPDGTATNLWDETDTSLTLVPDPPPPAATPVPTVTPAPVIVAHAPPVAVPQVAKLTAALGAAPATIKRNRSMTLKLTLTDDGLKATSAITVTIASARGLSLAKRTIRTTKLKPGQKRTLKLKVKLTRKAKTTTPLKVTARAGKLKSTTSLLLRIGKARKAPTTPATKKSPIVGTYWWRNVNHVDYAWDNRALYFVDDKTVYSGFPAGGLPVSCATAPAQPQDEVDERDGCLPYTYDAKTGALTVGEKTGTFRPGSLTLDGNSYSSLSLPAANARFGVNELQHTSFRGLCGLITGCTITEDYLTLTPDGQFVWSHSTTASVGDPISGPYTVAGSYPPDQHGTYTVLDGGKIHLAYADGSAKDETFAVLTNDKTGAPDPVGEGVMLGDENFYPDPTPG